MPYPPDMSKTPAEQITELTAFKDALIANADQGDTEAAAVDSEVKDAATALETARGRYNAAQDAFEHNQAKRYQRQRASLVQQEIDALQARVDKNPGHPAIDPQPPA